MLLQWYEMVISDNRNSMYTFWLVASHPFSQRKQIFKSFFDSIVLETHETICESSLSRFWNFIIWPTNRENNDVFKVLIGPMLECFKLMGRKKSLKLHMLHVDLDQLKHNECLFKRTGEKFLSSSNGIRSTLSGAL